MRFTIVTLFPEFFDSPLASGLMGKAREAGLVSVGCVNPRDFALDRHRTVDDRPYGGGPGMVMAPGPMAAALRSIETPGRMLLLSPKGRPLTQALARELAAEPAVTLICGRYEGLDARLESLFPLEPVSVGDFVLNGGEAGALCLIEAAARLVPGFMGHEGSGDEESFSSGVLEYPHYTRPEEFEGQRVPDILLSGDHARIAAWRRQASLRATLAARPDMLPEAFLDAADAALLRAETASHAQARLGRNLYVALLHHPVQNKFGKTVAVSLTNLDIHDIARVSRTYGLGGYYIATPIEDQMRLLGTLLDHWVSGPGQKAIPDRAEALSTVRPAASLDEAVDDIVQRTGSVPKLVMTSAQGAGTMTTGQARAWLENVPVLLVLGTGSGLAPEVVDRADGMLRPVRFMDAYNHLSVRAAAAVLVDRLLGDAF